MSLANLRQDQMRKLVKDYFQSSLDKYLSRLDNSGLSKNALVDMQHEIDLHEDFLGFDTQNSQYLPVSNFRKKADLSDADWNENEFALIQEMRKARRDVLKSVLSAAEARNVYFDTAQSVAGKALWKRLRLPR